MARLRHSTNLGWVDSADGHEGATVRVSDLSRLLDYVEGMRWRAITEESPPAERAAILLYCPGESFEENDLCRAHSENVEPAFFDGEWRYAWTGHEIFEDGNAIPTHWMPLPPAPLHGKG